ncbi:MAG: hypothetical protein ACJAV4_001049 [Pontimonas sp.]|jgi:hypothetical protein
MILQGLALNLGTMPWFNPRFPALDERAVLVAGALPSWAIASSHTAGWVWTGMGSPEPWSVLRPQSPSLSPLERTRWSAQLLSPLHHRAVRLGALRLLDHRSTAMEVLLHAPNIDASAAQLMVLEEHCGSPLEDLVLARRSRAASKAKARATLAHIATLREVYPDIARYTS